MALDDHEPIIFGYCGESPITLGCECGWRDDHPTTWVEHLAPDRERLRSAVAQLPAYLIEAMVPLASLDQSTTKRVEIPNASVILTRLPSEDGFVQRSDVLAIVDRMLGR